jgi:hypothetical protein
MVILFIMHIIAIIAIICIEIMSVMHVIVIIAIIANCFLIGWLKSVGSRVVYELDYKKPVLYAIPIQCILGKLPLPVVL